MRWALLLVVVLLASGVAAAPWGCCVPATDVCFSGSSFASQSVFQQACADAGGTVKVPGAETCNDVPECTIRCCCATSNVPNSAQVNSNEDLLRITQYACTQKSTSDETYEARDLPPGSTCVQVCGGTPPPAGNTHTVSGTIINATSSRPIQDVNVFIPVPSGYISAKTDSTGRFRLLNVPTMNTRVFAIHPHCKPGQSAPMLVDKDITGVSISLNCQLNNCQHPTPSFSQQPKLVKGTEKITFTVQMQDACLDFIHYEPLRCDANGANCIVLAPSTSATIVDSNEQVAEPIRPTTKYCYKVRARFQDGSATTSTQACVTTGDAACMVSETPPPSWCGTAGTPPVSGVVTCDDSNKLKMLDACQSTEVCSSIGDEPACVPAPQCERCNGLLGLFAKLGLTIPLGELSIQCREAQLCYEDKAKGQKPLLVDAYSSCTGVSSCTQYRSEAACTKNACAVADGCAWKPINAELGNGICVSTTFPECSKCDDVLGYCDAQSCGKISTECYFDGEANRMNEAKGCLHKSEMACRYYDTQQHCTGGTNAVYNIQYSGNDRTGDNSRTTASNDLLDIGACTWSADHCFKNADMKTTMQEDDCIESNRILTDPLCVRDSKPPVTTVYLDKTTTPPVYSRVNFRLIPHYATDDRTPVDRIKTYVCFRKAGDAPCYPKDTFSNVGAPAEGAYEMRYYSVDENGNHEQVKTAQIMIKDTHEATLDSVEIKESN